MAGQGRQLKVILRPTTEFSGATLSHLRQLDEAKHPATRASYVWVAGEGDLCKDVRRHVIDSWGLKSDSVQWCPYWFIGRARP
ncbi:SIP domain-containing protein [Pseudoglutamicibacter albus]|uniref:SIP domain-containing protein n=1 Tax=Pseudoglutamicibacter albus TaxID=98671 RepID=UPI003613F560